MPWCWFFHIENFSDWRVFKPGEILIGHEKFPITAKQPNSMTGDVCDINLVSEIYFQYIPHPVQANQQADSIDHLLMRPLFFLVFHCCL